jgi:hypothetical protein
MGGEMLTWLADVLRSAGLPVVELDGWRTRTRSGGITPQGVVWHHTATPKTATDATVARILRDGRSDLPGPLSQLGLRRDGTFVVIAAGRCNHNGFGTWGNDSIGIEAYNDGVGEPWPNCQVDAYVRGTAAICAHLGWGAERVKAHRETDPTRKVDPKGLDMTAARGRIASLLTQPREDDDDMALIVKGDASPEWWITDGLQKDHLETPDIAGGLVFTGLAKWDQTNRAPFTVGQAWIDSIPRVVKPESVAAAVIAALPPAQAGSLTAAQVADEIARRLVVR